MQDSLTIAENKIYGNFVHVFTTLQVPQIFVELLEISRSIYNFHVNFDETISNIKYKIEKKKKMESEDLFVNVREYKLSFHDMELDDSYCLTDYGIKNETVLQLCKDKIIFVKSLSENKFEI